MGFLKTFGSVAGKAANAGLDSIQKGVEKRDRAANRATGMSDAQLKRKFSETSSSWEKSAYLKEYKSRHGK